MFHLFRPSSQLEPFKLPCCPLHYFIVCIFPVLICGAHYILWKLYHSMKSFICRECTTNCLYVLEMSMKYIAVSNIPHTFLALKILFFKSFSLSKFSLGIDNVTSVYPWCCPSFFQIYLYLYFIELPLKLLSTSSPRQKVVQGSWVVCSDVSSPFYQ